MTGVYQYVGGVHVPYVGHPPEAAEGRDGRGRHHHGHGLTGGPRQDPHTARGSVWSESSVVANFAQRELHMRVFLPASQM